MKLKRKDPGRYGMLTIAICEDEKYILETLCKKVDAYIKKKKVSADIRAYLSGEDLLKGNPAFDIILLDMMLPGINGLEAAKRLSHKSCIIFITSYKEYALGAFEVDAVHYLIKPVSDERLYLALDRAMSRMEQAGHKALALSKAGKTQVIPIHDILYGEVFNHQVCIHTEREVYEYSGTLDGLEKELDECFFRCHRSYIINISKVVGREEGMAMLSNGDKIFISRRKQSEFMRKLLKYFKKESV